LVGSSPRHIAASHVLHRLLTPRHPPCALGNLTHTAQPQPTPQPPHVQWHYNHTAHPRAITRGDAPAAPWTQWTQWTHTCTTVHDSARLHRTRAHKAPAPRVLAGTMAAASVESLDARTHSALVKDQPSTPHPDQPPARFVSCTSRHERCGTGCVARSENPTVRATHPRRWPVLSTTHQRHTVAW
jgi:hypothetical protein